MNFLKKKFSITTALVLLLGVFLFSSCNKAEEVVESLYASLPNATVGEYEGELTYNGSSVITTQGTATITSTGDKTYKITFSDDVPAITNVKFSVAGDTYTSVSVSGSTGAITVTGSSLSVGITAGEGTWAFAGDKK